MGGIGERHPRRRRWVGRVVVLLVLVIVAVSGYQAYLAVRRSLFSASCTVTASGTSFTFTPEQTANAALIAALSVKRGLPARAATIALATALQESKLLNLTYGDRDSVGLFQQRPSQGWGTKAQILDPAYSTNKFYDALIKVKDYQTGEITKVAQAVQRSGFPEAYADHEQQGRVLASTLTGQSPAGLGCQVEPVARPANGAAAATGASIAADLAAQLDSTATVEGGQLTVAAPDAVRAWAAAQWAVARAQAYGIDRVQVAGRTWDRAEDASALTWGQGGSAGATTVVIRIGTATG
jgi:hypothetical protein